MVGLSKQGQDVLKAFRKLPRQEQAEIIAEGVRALAVNIATVAPTAGPNKCSKAQAALKQGVAEKLITRAGGIFLGEKQLKELGVIPKDATIPPVPEKFSKAFLNAPHPLRGGTMAEHIILGFDPATNTWYCFEKSIVPGSLGANGKGLPWYKQYKLLLNRNQGYTRVEGMRYDSPRDYRPIKRVLNNVIKLHLKNGGKDEDLPFYGVYGRTADSQNAAPGCLVLVGLSDCRGSVDNRGSYTSDVVRANIGLLAEWN